MARASLSATRYCAHFVDKNVTVYVALNELIVLTYQYRYRLFEYIMANQVDRDLAAAVTYFGSNPIGRFETWKFITQNWEEINEK